jgi:hypothetical protein
VPTPDPAPTKPTPTHGGSGGTLGRFQGATGFGGRPTTEADPVGLPGGASPPARYSLPARSPSHGLAVTLSREKNQTAPGLLAKPFLFQVPPLDSFQVQSSYSYVDYDTVRLGQFSRASGSQLTTVEFNTLLLDYSTSYGVRPDYWAGDPLEVADELNLILDLGTPVRLVCINADVGTTELNMPATLRGLSVEQRAGEPDARYVNVQFTEWKSAALTRRRRKKGSG